MAKPNRAKSGIVEFPCKKLEMRSAMLISKP